jgi:SAM-dependent methyltransferase
MDKWLEYWQQDQLQPDVFTDEEGNKHADLLAFWQSHICKFGKSASLLDIASGAGAIYRCIPTIDQYDAHALDISEDALAILKEDIPSVHTYAGPLNIKTLAQNQFDGVVSQFGIEYLSGEGFAQVPRLLKSGGKCVFLCHIKGGVIDSVTEQSLNGLTLVQDTRFLALARLVAEAFKVDQKQQVEQSVEAFMSVEPKIAAYCAEVPNGHHVHLYQGIKQLLSRYNQYEHSTVIEWIDTAHEQALENVERLQSMHNAALTQNDITYISNSLAQQGLLITTAVPFHLRAEDPPVAWEILGFKQS